MAKPPVHVTVTGAGGQIGYSLLFRLASGQLLGEDQPIVLRLLEIEPAMKVLEGVCMEIDDGAFPLVHDIVRHLGPQDGIRRHVVGAAGRFDPPQGGHGARRSPQRQRRHLQAAGPGHRRERRLRRAHPRGRQPLQHQLPHRAVQHARGARRPLVRHDPPRREPGQGAAGSQGRCAGGRRSPTWPSGATTRRPSSPTSPTPRIGGKPATDVITDEEWLRGEFITTVQKRGAAIIDARGSSSAASAAAAAIDTVVSAAHRDAEGRLLLGRRGERGPVRGARGTAVRVPGALPTAREAGRSSRASAATTSPPSASGSRPTSCWPSARGETLGLIG